MKKQLLLLLAILLHLSGGIAQFTNSDLQNKYWTSRNRLKKFFVTARSGPGNGIPTQGIELSGTPDYIYTRQMLASNGTDSLIPDSLWGRNLANIVNTEPIGKIGSDNPIITIGEYLSVLSTEYWLLVYYGKNNSEEMTALKNEIYYALAAVDRLDGTAEPYFKEQLPINYNGFLRRDDVEDNREDRVNNYQFQRPGFNGEIQMKTMANRGKITPDTILTTIDSFYQVIRVKVKDTLFVDTVWTGSTYRLDSSYNPVVKDSITNVRLGKKHHRFYKRGYRIKDSEIWRPEREDGVWDRGPGRLANEMSMDEMIGLMTGITYINKFVDTNATAQPLNSDSLKYLVKWSRDIMHRLMVHLSDSTEDVRALEPKAYEMQQIYACIKDRKGKQAKDSVKNKIAEISVVCPECGDHELYSKYTSEIGKGSVFNPVIFKKANYILTNPAADGRHVHRGPYAFVYGYPLEKLGEKITGHNYPGVFANLDDEEQVLRVFADLGWGGQSRKILMFPMLFWAADEAIGKDGAVWDNMANELNTRCFGLSAAGLDQTSLCLTALPFVPGETAWWQRVWENMGDTNKVISKIWRKYATEAGSANVMAAKLAACSGSWAQHDFARFAEDCGFGLMSLQYDVLNDKNPIHSKSYYLDLLNKVDCQGSDASGFPFDRDALGGSSMTPSKSAIDYGTNQDFIPNFGFMLYYNLYRIASIKYWGATENNYFDNSCPCHHDTVNKGRELRASAIRPQYEVTLSQNNKWIERHLYKNAYNQTTVIVETEDANPLHVAVGIRNAEYLNHNYQVNNNQIFKVTRDLVICGSELKVKSGATLQIDSSRNLESPNEIIVRSGNLILESTAVLNVSNYSRLIVEYAGKLVYNTGARIILNGPNAVLHIKGKLELAPGAEFKIEGGPAGKGYIIWDNGDGSPHYGLATLEAGAGSSMFIEQANPNVLGLKVEGSTGMVTPFSLAKLKIQNCRVALGPASQLVSQADSTIVHNVQVKGYFGPHANTEFNYKATAKGLHQLGKRNSYKMVTISECAIGLTVFNLGTSEALNMQDVYFENCLTAIHNRGGRLRYKDGNIRAVSLGGAYMDLRNGIYGEGTQGASMLENVELSARHFPNPVYHPLGAMEQTHNLKVHGAGNYYFYKSKIQFADYGGKMDQAGLLPVCTEIFDNTTQLQHTTWSKFVAVNQAWNHIHWPSSPAPSNPKKMYFGYMSYLYLDKGQNQIMSYTGGLPNLQALLATDQNVTTSTDALKWNTNAIPASLNQWQTAIETQPAANYNAIVEQGFPLVSNLDLNKMPVNTSNWQTTQANYCMNLKTPFSPRIGGGETESDTGIYGNGVGNGERRMPVSPADLGTMLTGHGQNGAAYVQSLRRVLRAMDMQPPNYGAIVDTFAQLLTQPLPDTVSAAVKHVYGLLQDFYLEVRTDGFIPEQDRLVQEQLVFAKMLALQNQLLVLSTDTNSIWHIPSFELTRDKALLYRVFNQRTEAIAFLDTKIPSWQPLFEKEALEVWKCLLTWEQSYIDGQVTYDSLMAYSCVDNLAAANNNLGNRVENKKTIGDRTQEMEKIEIAKSLEKDSQKESEMRRQFELYPNPAENTITIKAKSGIVSYKIYETNGRLVVNRKAAGETGLEVNIENLVRGTYIVEIESKTATYRTTLVVNR